MMQAQIKPHISYEKITKLPVDEIVKADRVGGGIIVSTPHKGNIFIDFKEVTGFFTRRVIERPFGDILAEIQKLDDEAKEFLLDKWLEKK